MNIAYSSNVMLSTTGPQRITSMHKQILFRFHVFIRSKMPTYFETTWIGQQQKRDQNSAEKIRTQNMTWYFMITDSTCVTRNAAQLVTKINFLVIHAENGKRIRRLRVMIYIKHWSSVIIGRKYHWIVGISRSFNSLRSTFSKSETEANIFLIPWIFGSNQWFSLYWNYNVLRSNFNRVFYCSVVNCWCHIYCGSCR